MTNPLADTFTATTTVGSTKNLYIGASQEDVDALAAEETLAALKKGKTVRSPGGRVEFYTDRVVFDATEGLDESDRYTWDRSGNRVKYEKFHVVVVGTEKTETFLRNVWKNYE